MEGKISGIVNFGAFVKFALPGKTLEETQEENLLEGLIHISELDWQLIEDPFQIVQVGDKVTVKVIDVSQGRVSLSLKAMKKDPWQELNLKQGDIVKGTVIRFNPFGAFVQLKKEEEGDDQIRIQGLIHISEFGAESKMKEALEAGKEYEFQIMSFQPQRHWMSLKLKK